MYSMFGPIPSLTYLSETCVAAGFTSAAEDYIVKPLSLTDLLLLDDEATVCMKAKGDSMTDAGILDGSLMVVNRRIGWRHGQVVIADIDNEFTVKYLHLRGRDIWLHAANSKYPPIVPQPGQTWKRFGVVLGVLVLFPPSKLA